MPISMNCPHCGAAYRLADQFAGRKVRCKKCNQVFVVASADQPPVVQSAGTTDVSDVQPVSRLSRPSIPPVQPVAQDLAARVVKKSRDSSSSSVIFWLLLLGGIGLTMVLVVGLGGMALWLVFRHSSSQNLADMIQGGSTSAKGIEELKSATVFVKVAAGRVRATGSGFVMRVEGNTGYVVTNDHVVHPKAQPGVAEPGVQNPEVTLVFWSGNKLEQSYRAEVVAADAERDLAVVKVSGVANLPNPIDINSPKLVETLPVTVFGFPFGEALAGRAGNPAITVSKASISSIRRNDRDDVIAVQIDGALNPGNSGGPVVDADGRLVGVAVATIRGAHIGLAIPAGELLKIFEGAVGEVRAVTRNVTDANATIDVEVSLIDPLKRIQSVAVHYLRSDQVKDNPQANLAGDTSELPGSQCLTLRLEGQRAVGTLSVLSSDKDRPYTFQAEYVDDTGRRVYMQPRSLQMRPPGVPVATQPGPVVLPPVIRVPPPVMRVPRPNPRPRPRPLPRGRVQGEPPTGNRAIWDETGDNRTISLAFSPDSATLAVGHWDGRLRLWDVANNRDRKILFVDKNKSSLLAMTFSKDGKQLATGGCKGRIILWDPIEGKDLRNFQVLHTRDGEVNQETAMAFTPDGRTLAVGIQPNNASGEVHLWNLETNKEFAVLPKLEVVKKLAYAPDGALVVMMTTTVKVCDPATLQVRREFKAEHPSEAFLASALSQDGLTLATFGVDQKLKLWRLATGDCLQTWMMNADVISHMCWPLEFSPDGKFLALGARGPHLHLWDAKNGKELKVGRIEGSAGYVDVVAFSPNSKYLACHSSNGPRILDIDKWLSGKAP